MVVTDRQMDGGQMDKNVTLCGLYLCDVTRLLQYAIIPSLLTTKVNYVFHRSLSVSEYV